MCLAKIRATTINPIPNQLEKNRLQFREGLRRMFQYPIEGGLYLNCDVNRDYKVHVCNSNPFWEGLSDHTKLTCIKVSWN